LYDAFRADSRIDFLDEPPALPALWREHTDRQTYSPKVWNDAYLAAFACTGDLKLVTFDQSFAQYAGLSAEILT
jgi:predicted nucleic acid-binding protein